MSPGDVVEVRGKSQEVVRIVESIESVDRRGIPAWLTVERKDFKGEVTTLPSREDIVMPIQEQLIVELYSK
jgi:small subunit ribosomal protein S4